MRTETKGYCIIDETAGSRQQVLTYSNNNLFKDNQMADKQSVCVYACVYVADEGEEPIVISVSA